MSDQNDSNNISNSPISTTDANFESDVLNSEVPVLVDFWAEWCGPCKMIAPVLDELAADYGGKVKIAKLDIDANPQTAAKFAIRSIPALMLFKNGEVAAQSVGVASKSKLTAMVETAL